MIRRNYVILLLLVNATLIVCDGETINYLCYKWDKEKYPDVNKFLATFPIFNFHYYDVVNEYRQTIEWR